MYYCTSYSYDYVQYTLGMRTRNFYLLLWLFVASSCVSKTLRCWRIPPESCWRLTIIDNQITRTTELNSLPFSHSSDSGCCCYLARLFSVLNTHYFFFVAVLIITRQPYWLAYLSFSAFSTRRNMSFQDVGRHNSNRQVASAGLRNQPASIPETSSWGTSGSSSSVGQISESLTQYQVRSSSLVDHSLRFKHHCSLLIVDFCLMIQRNVGILEKIAQQLLASTSNKSARAELEQQYVVVFFLEKWAQRMAWSDTVYFPFALRISFVNTKDINASWTSWVNWSSE